MFCFLLAAALLLSAPPSFSADGSFAPARPLSADYQDLQERLRAAPAQVAGLPIGDPLQEGLDGPALKEMLEHAAKGRSDAVVVLKNGKVVVYERFGKEDAPVQLRSVTKVLTGTAVGMLLDQGALTGADAPVHPYLSGWEAGDKSRVTLRHILTHTSGLKFIRGDPWVGWGPDAVRIASELPMEHPPGTFEAYNNAAVMLLSTVIRKAAGMPVDRYLEEELFRPLGFGAWEWHQDDAGNTFTYAGLALRGIDLAKFGQLWLQKGRWRGAQLISQDYVAAATTSHTPVAPLWGYLWVVSGLRPGEPRGFWMSGSGYQYLFVYPDQQLVCVQLVRRWADPADERELSQFQASALRLALTAR